MTDDDDDDDDDDAPDAPRGGLFLLYHKNSKQNPRDERKIC